MTPEEQLNDHFPLADAIDHEVLMHRDAHFGGLFSVMLEYYRNEGKGVQPDFTIKRIERLALLEDQLKENLAALFLTSQEAQRVADAREAYETLRAIYGVKNPKNIQPRLIADLILTEDEEGEDEVNAIAAEKEKIVPALIQLLANEQYHDPLFPGYGMAPPLIVKCLGAIGDKKAIISLFEALGKDDFFTDEQILKAFKMIGDPAKAFLLKVLEGRPLNEDNERAAIALVAFKDDPEVASACFELLKQPDIQKDICLSTYCALACAGLQDLSQREAYKAMAEKLDKSSLKEDMKSIIREWVY
jgi:HEAT repeat protein